MRAEEYFREKGELINRTLEEILPPRDDLLKEITDAMRYTLLLGGKRVRPILALAAYETVKGEDPDAIAPIAVSVEFIHAYSLIHDDLPAMDDDAERRGIPSNHMVFGEDMAILAGDGLLTEAFKVIVEGCERAGIPMEKAASIVKLLSEKAGYRGMVGGQAMDVRWDKLPTTVIILNKVVVRKTAALIEGSVLMGGILADAGPREMRSLSEYGKLIGIAFQMVDDLHDFPENRESPSYPSVIGVEATRREVERLTKKAKDSISIFGEDTILHSIADFLRDRTH